MLLAVLAVNNGMQPGSLHQTLTVLPPTVIECHQNRRSGKGAHMYKKNVLWLKYQIKKNKKIFVR